MLRSKKNHQVDWGRSLPDLPRGIVPMDLDGFMEYHHHFLVFEHKYPGQEVPKAQSLALRRLTAQPRVWVAYVWAERTEEGTLFNVHRVLLDRDPTVFQTFEGIDALVAVVQEFLEWAESHR